MFEKEFAFKHPNPQINQDHEQAKEKVEALKKVVYEISKTNKDNKQLKNKVEVLEKVVHVMTRNVLNLEIEINKIKK